jgi:heme oxygenase
MSENGSVLWHLRRATRCLHERVEARANVVERLASPGTRAATVQQYCRLHIPAERALNRWLAAIPGLDFDLRVRGPALARALHRLGAAIPSALPAVQIDSRSAALGFFYVLEGSTLGGHVISRELERRGVDQTGLEFLNPYGARTGACWRAFLEVLGREIGTVPERVAAATEGAMQGFRHAEACLVEERAAA